MVEEEGEESGVDVWGGGDIDGDVVDKNEGK